MRKYIITCLEMMPLIFLLTLTALFYIRSNTVFSVNEKRYMAQEPKLEVSKIYTSQYMEEFEEFVADQFPFRDEFIRINKRIKIGTEVK